MSRLMLTFPRCVNSIIGLQRSQLQRQSLNISSPICSKMLYSSNKGSGDPQEQDVVDREQALPNEAVFYHPKHDMYVCWHKEVPFPYEMSRPIPQETHVTESNLNIQALVPVREVFRKKDNRLMIRELMQLTYTAKYKWLGKHGRKKKDVLRDMDPLKQKRDREYL